MTRRQRWQRVRLLLLGLALTAAVATVDSAGGLDAFEKFTYDQRVKYCQHWQPPPDAGLVHVLIDDQSIKAIGRWPWSRATVADLLDEAAADGAGQFAFDVLYDDPEKYTLTPEQPVSPDARLAHSIASARDRGMGVLLPVSLDFADADAPDPVLQRCVDLLSNRLGTPPATLASVLQLPADTVRQRYYSAAFDAALAVTARQVVRDGRLDDDAAVGQQFPELVQGRTPQGTPESRRFRDALKQARTSAGIEARLQPAGDAAGLVPATTDAVPLPELAAAATRFAFVNYRAGRGGTVRSVPLVLNEQGRLVPQFGLALALLRLGIDPADPRQFEANAESVVLRPPGRAAIRVPVRLAVTGEPPRPVGALFDIPMRGGDHWWESFAPRTDAFLSALELWRVHATERAVRQNVAVIIPMARRVYEGEDTPGQARPVPPADDLAGRLAYCRGALDLIRKADADMSPEATAKLTPEKLAALDAGEREQRTVIADLDRDLAITQALNAQLAALRQQLSAKIAGKLLVLGYASTGAAADHVPTATYDDCPGVVVHGQIANAILTGETWTHLPPVYALVLTVLCGLAVTTFVTMLNPWQAFFASDGLLATVVGGASVGLFDYGNVVIGLAGPIAAIGVCWAACTLVVTLRERLDRAMVTRRFRSYVDPALVNYVLEHPEQNTLAGRTLELTVVFIDVAGFTTLTERMGERSIAILRQLMDALVPIIRANGGFVNKFLGDGIMFFYGAPQPDADHARHAVRTVLGLQKALGAVNARLAEAGLPKLGVRAGISTGPMLVGDAGSADASDYTVLGDAVNLGARLESANKALGTAALCTQRTAELCGDEFLFVPLGRLKVVGKDEAVAVCEPLCALADATPEQLHCAESLAAIWQHLNAREAMAALSRLDQFRATGQRTQTCDLLQTLVDELADDPAVQDVCIRLSGK